MSSQRWKNVLVGRLIRRKRNWDAFCFSTSSSVCMAIIPAPDAIPPTELSEAAGFTGICCGSVTSSRFQTKSNGGARLVKKAADSKINPVFDFSVASAVKVFPSKDQQMRTGEPFIDFCQFD